MGGKHYIKLKIKETKIKGKLLTEFKIWDTKDWGEIPLTSDIEHIKLTTSNVLWAQQYLRSRHIS